MFDLFERIHHATLSGFPLLVVMLACFLVGAISTRLALEVDARALWRFVLARKPREDPDATVREDEHE